ncbi:hypothetical protein LMG24235_08478 [Paraburkholderia sabiae]|nr:hypothetical protein LMG24235_08478 [Paraburkholderia sabiae]
MLRARDLRKMVQCYEWEEKSLDRLPFHEFEQVGEVPAGRFPHKYEQSTVLPTNEHFLTGHIEVQSSELKCASF